MSMLREDQDAEEVAPWRPGDGPKPAVHVFPPSERPMLRVRTQGRWHTTVVLARYDHHDGRAAYQVDINLTIDGLHHVGTSRTYWWNPKAMKPVRPGTR
ncbi:hypothetical protein E4198_00025 [Streptomyces sp. RKND-216]|uniref:hypothetical protein n=1 Tax=Streptomyces sp. RKND-216 TaxID=2562581 RepID=UPI00109DD4C1|nr:hypothetical protein [Streptomyces sp. RKND-216]THA28237.1 hypothetical protein E4198_00025 [Streptomyces sp. RKND-216]